MLSTLACLTYPTSQVLKTNAAEEEKTQLDRVMLANSILLLSFGVPFVHMGQEIGLSKDGLDNTYKTLGVNNMDYRLVDERFDMVNRFRLMNTVRKKLGYLKLFKADDIKKVFDVAHWDNGLYVLVAKNQNIINHEKEFVIMFNPTDRAVSFELDDYYTVLEGVKEKHAINIKNGFLPGCNLLMLYK